MDDPFAVRYLWQLLPSDQLRCSFTKGLATDVNYLQDCTACCRMGMLKGWGSRGACNSSQERNTSLYGIFRSQQEKLQHSPQKKDNNSDSPHPKEYLISGHVDPSGREIPGLLYGRWSCLCRSCTLHLFHWSTSCTCRRTGQNIKCHFKVANYTAFVLVTTICAAH